MDEHTEYRDVEVDCVVTSITRRVPHRSCNAVTSDHCEAPPAFADSYTKGTCFGCGMPVCSRCSSRVKWYRYGRRRICDNCLEEHRDEYGQALVLRRRYHEAGYTGVTLQQCLEKIEHDAARANPLSGVSCNGLCPVCCPEYRRA